MNEVPQQEAEETEKERACKIANSLVSKRLTSKLESNPSADLSQLLEHEAKAYPKLCDSLVRAAAKPKAGSGSGEDEPRGAGAAGPAKTELSPPLLDGDIEIICPLEGDVLSLVNATEQSTAGLSRAIENGKTLWRLHQRKVVELNASLVVKIGTPDDHDEINNLRYINVHAPGVAAPSCYGAFRSERRIYHFMSRADGVTLESIWPQLLTVHKSSVQRQLNEILRRLRAGRRNSHLGNDDVVKMGGFVSGTCKDSRRSLRTSQQPLCSEADFNDFLCRHDGRTQTPWIKMVRSFMRDDHALVMTHGDLHPRNIMVKWDTAGEGQPEGQKSVRVTALIDWELAGWYPAYWEFAKALSTVPARGPLADWCDYLPTEAIGQWPMEYSIDLLISRWVG